MTNNLRQKYFTRNKGEKAKDIEGLHYFDINYLPLSLHIHFPITKPTN